MKLFPRETLISREDRGPSRAESAPGRPREPFPGSTASSPRALQRPPAQRSRVGSARGLGDRSRPGSVDGAQGGGAEGDGAKLAPRKGRRRLQPSRGTAMGRPVPEQGARDKAEVGVPRRNRCRRNARLPRSATLAKPRFLGSPEASTPRPARVHGLDCTMSGAELAPRTGCGEKERGGRAPERLPPRAEPPAPAVMRRA